MNINIFTLGNDKQVLKPKSVGRLLMVYEFVCPFHGKMVDPDKGKPCRVILKYGKNYDGYWKGEYVAIQPQDTHTTFIKIHPDFLPLYVSKKSENHHKISTDALNSRKLNLKYGGGNTPLL